MQVPTPSAGDLTGWRFDVFVTDMGRLEDLEAAEGHPAAAKVATGTMADARGHLFVPAPPLRSRAGDEEALPPEAPPFDPSDLPWVRGSADLLGRVIRIEVFSTTPYSSKVVDFVVAFGPHGPEPVAMGSLPKVRSAPFASQPVPGCAGAYAPPLSPTLPRQAQPDPVSAAIPKSLAETVDLEHHWVLAHDPTWLANMGATHSARRR